MKDNKPKTRTEAAAPAATEHLEENQKKALDLLADAEHANGPEREKVTRQIERLGASRKMARSEGRPDTRAGSRLMRGQPCIPRTLTSHDMNNLISQSNRPLRNITWLAQAQPPPCEHRHEVVTYAKGVTLKRCVQCGRVEIR